MRRHAVLERVEVEAEVIRVHTAFDHLVAILLLLVDTLTAGGDLQAAHQQVETQRERRVFRIIHSIERTVLAREVGYEHKVRTVCFKCILADSALLFRREIILAAVVGFAQLILPKDFVHLTQFPRRHLVRQYRQCSAEQVQLVGALLAHRLDDMLQQACLKLHHILLTLDKAHLHIQRDILVQVARGIVLLGAISRGDLKHTLIHSYADLLVELR